ncbi:MAG TPA: hypothetical protein DCS07_13055, partial [Bdellovibrionales bacterium]|nr:hypothetical protein [Bdellovibrionales bacterium]
TVIATATLLAKFLAGSALKDIPQAEVPHALPSAIATLRYSLTSFSLWSHVQGVLYGWVQTMDLFVLGLGGLLGGAAVIPAATLGLYATVSKLTGFAFALPQALGNLFSLWLGRRTSDPSERKRVWNTSGGLFLIGVAQALVLTLLAPLILHFLSRGRFSPSDIAEMSHWFYFKIWSTTGWVAALVMMSWLFARGHIRAVLFQITLPWAAFSLLAFTLAARLGGPSATAQANVLSAGVLCALSIGLFLRKR